MSEQAKARRTGSVMILAGWVGDRPEYREVSVREEDDGSVSYYHGGPTCRTADGRVTLPAEYVAKVTWR
jgi:hypothetical protein